MDVWYFRARGLKGGLRGQRRYGPGQQGGPGLSSSTTGYSDYDGNFIGVTGIGLTADTVHTLVKGYREKFRRSVYFLNPDGSMNDFDTSGDGAAGQVGSLDGLATIRDRIVSEPEGSFQYEAPEGTFLVSSRFIPELNWFLIVEQAERYVTAGIRRTLMINLGICAVILVLVLGHRRHDVQRVPQTVGRSGDP